MTLIGKGYDSANSQDKCDYCLCRLQEDKIVLGTGNALLSIYHPLCWDILLAVMEEKSPSPGSSEEGVIPGYNT